MYIAEFEQYIKAEKRFSAHTVKAYLDDLNQFFDFLTNEYQETDVTKIDHLSIRAWMVNLFAEQNLSARSVNRKLSSLKTYFRYLRKLDIIKTSPMLKVVSPKMESRLPEFVEQKNMEKLHMAGVFDDDFEGVRNRLILELLYQTGMRQAELLHIELKDVDIEQGYMMVTGKRNKQRMLPLADELLSLVESYIARRKVVSPESDKLILTAKGKAAYPKLIYRVVNNYLAKVTTINKKSPHVLRHTFATHMLNNGADLHAIKELLGHASLSATQVYTHNTFEKLKSIYNKAHPRA